VTGVDGEISTGLRERRKLRTRASLIDAALALADRQGYENTTVEQIADAADVSPRTFARYFPTKDSVIAALLVDLTLAVNAELARQPADLPPFEALLAANLAVMDQARNGEGPMTAPRIMSLLRALNNSPALQTLAISVRSQETRDAMAKRLNTGNDDRTAQLISAVWAAIIASAWGSLGTPAGPEIASVDDLPDLMYQLLQNAFAEFSSVTGPMSSFR
jgi:AcrR family transcriptional regulator